MSAFTAMLRHIVPTISSASNTISTKRPNSLTKPFTPTLSTSTLHTQKYQHRSVTVSAEPPSSQGLAETAALDDLIDNLMAATDATDLATRVAENLMSFDQRFWLRVATRSDTATDPEDKERLASLAKVVMQLVDAIVKQTSEQLDTSSQILQDILKAAADERGEWQLPLSADQLTAMRAVMDNNVDKLDEALLSNCYAWMRKASEDKMDGMVALLQKVLQVYAGRELSSSTAPNSDSDSSKAAGLIQELLAADEALWTRILRSKVEEQGISEPAFMDALQRRMEGVVLGLASGSYSQRVQAEYLKELEARAREVFEDLAKGV